MEENGENVPQYHGGDVLMSIKTEPEIIYEREDNANSTTGLYQQVKREHTMDANEFESNEFKRAKNCCHNCLDLKSYIDHLFQKQSEKIQENKVEIMQALELQKDLTIRLLFQQQTGEDLKSAFPLTSQEALIQFDKNINEDNKHLYVNAMKELIRNNLFKNMAQIIAEDLVYNYNVDGSHGKQSFKDLNNFYSALKKYRNNHVSYDGDQLVKNVKIISQTEANKEDTLKLRELLKEFGLEKAFKYLEHAQVTYRSLQYLRKDDLREAIPPMGLRVEFREKLFEWRKRKFGIDEELMPTKVQEWLNEMPSFSSSQPQEQSPYNSRSVLNRDLKNILMETAKGKKLLQLYDENQLLNDTNRNDLLNIIIEEIVFSKIVLQQKDFITLVDEICTLFPTERDGQEYYYIPRQGKRNPSGRLYSKYANCRVKSKKLESSQPVESPPNTPACIKIENIDELSEIKMDLNREESNWNDIKDMWRATFNLRQMNRRTMSIEEFLKSWPRYRHSEASELINIDFMLMHPSKESLLFSNWLTFKDKIKQYYEISIHNENCNQLFSIGKTLTNKDSQDYIYTTLLNAIIPSTVRFKNLSGKCTKKFSIAEAQEIFALKVNSINDYEIKIEELINKYYSAELKIQPFLIVEGPSVWNLNGFYIYFDKNLYKFDSFCESLDICFKIFHTFSIPFPKACEPLWTFIQQYFFDIYMDVDCKSSTLISLLKFMKIS